VAYVLLTVALGLVYLAGVLLLRQVLDPLTGNSSLAVAGSTLTVAALFRPARRRIQDRVDRRFNRRRYDAARTVEAFSARLREEVDLDALTGEFLAVVDHTVEPTRASLWLRPLQRSEQPQASPVNRMLDRT
jgi:branched-subunit amino acid ABC-type transport system permease component